MEIAKMLLTLAVSAFFGFILFKLHIPGGFLVGSIVGALCLSAFTGLAEMPSAAKLMAQITAGAFIGTGITIADLKKIKHSILPIGIVIISLLFLNLAVGGAIHLLFGLDLLTALMCCIPGGMSDVPLIAADLGADLSPIVLAQFSRMLAGTGIFPALINKVGSHHCPEPDPETAKPSQSTARPAWNTPPWVAAVLLCAAVCGLVGKMLDIPAGALVFAMLGAMLFSLFIRPVRIPLSIKRIAQCLSGAYIGCSAGVNAFSGLGQLLLPILLIVTAYFVNALLTGRLITRLTGIPTKESMLMLTPAGASDMALISSEIGVDSPALVLMQVVRMIVAVSVFPVIDMLVVSLFY